MTDDIFENKLQRPDIARQRAMRGRYDVLLNTKAPVEQKPKTIASVNAVGVVDAEDVAAFIVENINQLGRQKCSSQKNN